MLIASALLFMFTAINSVDAKDNVIKTFTLEERFGVSHPNQIVDFDLDISVDPKTSIMVDSDGNEVPYQLLENGKKIAIKTDLPANTKRIWKLIKGRTPASYKYGVKVIKSDGYYEINNSIVGARIPIPTEKLDLTPAPIQGIRYPDGTWTASGPNYLTVRADKTKSMEVKFLEQGDLKVIVEVLYKFHRPVYNYDTLVYKEEGEGFYRSTIEIQSGQPSILFTEDTDMEFSYSMDLYSGLYPNEARYRGHHSTAKEYGYEPDGQQYRQSHTRPSMDATVDLAYGTAKASDYRSTQKSWRRMAVWDPWAFDTGWYWQMYNNGPGREEILLGIFAGRASKALGISDSSGVGIFTEPGKNEPKAGVTISTSLRGPDNRTFPRVRFSWGMFIGIKGEDLTSPDQVQSIARQMNLHSGFNLSKIHRYQLDFPDPKQGYGSLYMDNSVFKRIVEKVRTDKDYYSYLYNAEPTSRSLIDMWADTSGEKAKKAMNEILELGRNIMDRLVNGDGIYDFSIHYWHGGLQMMRYGLWIDQVLASGALTPAEMAKVKSIAVLFAEILWDNDFVPLFEGHGLNLGTENMPVQQTGYRHFYALLLSEHPDMKERAKAVTDDVLRAVNQIINENGAEMGCTHYIGASFAPTLNTLLQIRMLGKFDPFKTEPRLSKFADFYMNFLTPPEPRFNSNRKYVSFGDSSTESSEMYGQLATGFRDADPKLSAKLMGAWNAGGKKQSGFFGTTLIMIDGDAPSSDPNLGNATFPGYYSVIRNGWGTKNETAIWVINGDFYRDHRHADQGNVVIYALGAPLSVDWGSLYYPRVGGGFMHSIVTTEKDIGHSWDKDNPSLDSYDYRLWRDSKQEAFLSFDTCAYAVSRFQMGDGLVWNRSINSIYADPDHPVIVIHDKFDGKDANISKIFNLNLMAEGDVQTPSGKKIPPVRTYKNNEELPSAGEVFTLNSGISKLGFTGQFLIDWEIYTVSNEPQQAHIGNWAENWHQEVNNFEERQHILRIKGNKDFYMLILPYRKAEKLNANLTQDGDNVIVNTDSGKLVVGKGFYSFSDNQKSVLANLGDEPVEFGEIKISGTAEITMQGNQATIVVHGKKGVRKISLPDKWRLKAQNPSVVIKDGNVTIDYSGDEKMDINLEK